MERIGTVTLTMSMKLWPGDDNDVRFRCTYANGPTPDVLNFINNNLKRSVSPVSPDRGPYRYSDPHDEQLAVVAIRKKIKRGDAKQK